MANIGIDLDEVLADFNTPFFEYHNLKYKTNLKIEDFTSYFLRDIINITPAEEMLRLEDFCKTDYFKNILPFSETKKIIQNLTKNNNLYLITSRPDFMAKDTNKWIDRYFPNTFKEVIVTNHSAGGKLEKSEVCLNKNISIMIEDNSYYANDCALSGIKSFLITKPWNKNEKIEKDVVRVSDWSEIKEILNESL